MLALLICSAQGLVSTLVSCRSPSTDGRMDGWTDRRILPDEPRSVKACLDATVDRPACMLTVFSLAVVFGNRHIGKSVGGRTMMRGRTVMTRLSTVSGG